MSIPITSHPGARGTVSAHLFENSAVGVSRGLYWSVSMPCAPIIWEDEEWECSLSCEWLQWPIQNWEQLGSMSLGSALHPEAVECSFYMGEHHSVQISSLALNRVQLSSRFLARASGSLNLHGFGELDREAIQFSLECEAEFEGLIVVPGSLFPKPNNPEEAMAALVPFISLKNLQAPEWDRFRYVLKPGESAA